MKIYPTSSMSVGRQCFGLLAWLLVTFAAAALGNWATMSSVGDWYQRLNRPTWTPPDWIFAPVWTGLYAMMAVAAWLVWRPSGFAAAKWPLAWFGAQLVLNTLWSVVFFGLKSPGWAAVEIVVLWLAIVITLVAFWRRSVAAGLLFVPYAAWVTFAAALCFEFARINS